VTTDRDTPSEFQYFNGPFLTVPFLRESIDEYIPDPDDRVSELATPRNISKAHAAKQPPTLICNAAVDVLRDDGILFGEILQRAGVDVSVVTFHGQLHDSVVYEATRQGATPRSEVRLIAAQLKSALGGPVDTIGADKGKRQRDGVKMNGKASKRSKRKVR
jgi:acetyl esterase